LIKATKAEKSLSTDLGTVLLKHLCKT